MSREQGDQVREYVKSLKHTFTCGDVARHFVSIGVPLKTSQVHNYLKPFKDNGALEVVSAKMVRVGSKDSNVYRINQDRLAGETAQPGIADSALDKFIFSTPPQVVIDRFYRGTQIKGEI